MNKLRLGCGCLVLVAIVLVVIGGFFGSGDGSNTPEKHRITKAEWMQKAAALGGQGYRMSGVLLCGEKALYQAVGEPSSTQSIGDDVYLYWDCQDGQIQVVTPGGFLRTQGMVAGKINAY